MIRPIVVANKQLSIEVTRKNIKTVRLKVFPTQEIKLSVPSNTPDEWISDFIQQKRNWIEKKLIEFEKTRAIEKEEHIRSGISTRILGRQLTVKVMTSTSKRIEKTDSELLIFCPDQADQIAIDKQFNNWWQKNAKKYYIQVLESIYPIIEKHGFEKPSIVVKKMQTLWGSCSRKNGNVNLNFYLFKAPVPCIEYVILHELVHFLYPHHDKNFYDFLTIHMPDWKDRKKLLDYEIVLGV